MDTFWNGTGKTGTGHVSFTRKNSFEPFHFFRSCKGPLSMCSVPYIMGMVLRNHFAGIDFDHFGIKEAIFCLILVHGVLIGFLPFWTEEERF